MFVDSGAPNTETLNEEEQTWQERQDRLKKEYENWGGAYHAYKIKCFQCGNEFYARRPDAKYCNYWCTVDRYIQRRRELHGFKRWNGPCQYCNKEFVSSTVHAKYCSESHRVLACLKRRGKQ